MKAYISLLLTFLLFLTIGQGQTPQSVNVQNFKDHSPSFVQEELPSRAFERLKEVTPAEYYDHPEFGMLPPKAPCDTCIELLQERTTTQRKFLDLNNPNHFYIQKSYGKLHYQDESGNLRTLRTKLRPHPSKKSVYYAPNQPVPVRINTKTGTSVIKVQGLDFTFNENLTLFYEEGKKGNKIGKIDDNKTRVGSDGAFTRSAWPSIDRLQKVDRGQVKTNFHIREEPDYVSSRGELIIQDEISLPQGYIIRYDTTRGGEFTEEGYWKGALVVLDRSGEEVVVWDNIKIFETLQGQTSNIDVSQEQRGGQQSSVRHHPRNIVHGSYEVVENGSQYKIRMHVSMRAIQKAGLEYPITVDPLVKASSTYSNPRKLTYGITGDDCSGSDPWADGGGYCSHGPLTVNLPGESEITDTYFDFAQQMKANSCYCPEDAAFRLYGPCGYSPNGGFFSCQSGNCLNDFNTTCEGGDLSARNTTSCISPQCSDYSIDFFIRTYMCRDTCSEAGCTFGIADTTILYARARDWTVTVEGRTLEMTAPTSSQGSLTCDVDSTVLETDGQYGVPAYSYQWSSGQTDSSIKVSPDTQTTYTVSITDQCNNTVSNSITIDVDSILVNAGPADTICAGNDYMLNSSYGGNANVIRWSTTGDGSFDNDTITDPTYTHGPSDSANGSVQLILTADDTAGPCGPEADTVILTIFHVPTQPKSISRTGGDCEGDTNTFSISSVPLTNTYNWSVPVDWIILSGQGTDTLDVRIGADDGNVCVTADNRCGSSPSQCLSVETKDTSAAPSGVDATPDTICPSEPSTLSVVGGHLGSGAEWKWYTDSCGGTLVGTGSSIEVSPSSDTTYYVRAEGDCRTTACASTPVRLHVKPVADFGTSTECFTDTTHFTDSSSISTGTLSYAWDFDDGTTSSDTNPDHLYQSAGTFDAQLVVTSGKGCTDTAVRPVTVHPKPQADFTYSKDCDTPRVYFDDQTALSSGNLTSWDWSFGDGDTSDLENPVHEYDSLGYYQIRLEVTSDQGCGDTLDQVVQNDSIGVLSSAVIDFDYTQECFGDSTQFTNLSDSFTNKWDWSFGDGDTSDSLHPAHLYGVTDTYDVQLIAETDGGCKDTVMHTVPVFKNPEAGFTFAEACERKGTRFTDTSKGSVVMWDWSFDDGDTSDKQHPTHTYMNDGSYNVELIATNANGCPDTAVNAVPVNPTPTPDFGYQTDCARDTVFFTDSSTVTTDSVTGWKWHFGDGDSSSQQHPAHIYQNAGSYPVQLIAITNDGCRDTLTQSVPVHHNPVADFSSTVACFGDTTQFSDSSTVSSGNISSWDWTFDDGDTSDLQSPTHYYDTAGIYTVNLRVETDDDCADTVQRKAYVNTSPSADFVHDLPACERSVISFTDSSRIEAGAISQWTWTFDDGDTSYQQNPEHIFSDIGVYSVKLVTFAGTGCIDTAEREVSVRQAPIADYEVQNFCSNESTYFIDSSKADGTGGITDWDWDFGDGDTSDLSDPSHKYGIADTYSTVLTVTGSNGCTDSMHQQIEVNPHPRASFSYEHDCELLILNYTEFFDSTSIPSPGSLDSWHWSFGDEDTSVQQDPRHLYDSAGLYPVRLVVTSNEGCRDTTRDSARISIIPRETSIIPDSVCFGDSTNFRLRPDHKPAFIKWEFGDGTSLTDQYSPAHLYNKAGRYRVQLVYGDQFGCTDTTVRRTIVHNLPPLRLNPSPKATITRGDSILLKASGAAQYEWMPGSRLSDSTTNNPIAFPQQTTKYKVIGTSEEGCTGSDTVRVIVQDKTYPELFVPNAITPNEDGVNDVWRIQGLQRFDKASVEIYNRWGNLVFQSDNYNNDWRGGDREIDQLPSGTYYYVLHLDNKKTVTGSVSIIR